MNIAVLSDTRMPTKATGGHGLGRLAWDIAAGLVKRGHDVALHAGALTDHLHGADVYEWETERQCAEAVARQTGLNVIIDLSHHHDLSVLNPSLPVLNWIADTECRYTPPNAVVGNAWQQRQYPDARIVPLGIDVDAIPFTDALHVGDGFLSYLAFAAKIHPNKGYDLALAVHGRQDIPVRFVGERYVDDPLPHWTEVLHGADFYRFLGQACGLLSPSRHDAGGRVNLEAAACGTPTLCLDDTGTAEHVAHGVSGFVCRDLNELVDAVQDLPRLDRNAIRAWVRETHDLSVMLDELERLAHALADGETW